MKTEVTQIIGKTISGVFIKENQKSGHPCSQVFLTFDDGSCYEFYSSDGSISTTGPF